MPPRLHPNLTIRQIDWQQTIPVRHLVLWPDRPPAFSQVENDAAGQHFGGFIDDNLVCVASVFIEGEQARLRKYATLPQFQGQGVGTQVLSAIFAYLKQAKFSYFWCDARESAIGFYQRFGMQVEGERFYKSEVAYVKMAIKVENLPS
ncbi:GNAT family N-acetyltransferase [Oceanisphaera profunda]|uniref:GNAT family N-acetyltransferase n=1 Tax=Oceanisphaera profunda TaxID=1416627 RepID=A0A1Y0D2Z4_9GAMM|nr:GNAT family N-acetyltransferase [Oceanisphaera profunda]ART81587.1 GNAT family N-acetyltransferase [Oceanisphaera profunda]